MTAEKNMTTEEAAAKGLLSMDVAEEKRAELAQLFPEAFVDGSIDIDQLRRALGDWVEPTKERFGLNWPGKADCMNAIQAPSIATLKPAPDDSVNFGESGNLFIEGDNLEVLKLLQKSYFGKVKTIYIDPPYNTGNEFIYPDRYQESLDTYLLYTGQVDDEGRKFSTSIDQVGRRHSAWLNMMYSRLYICRNLLREDGVIFISIDDHEHANLKLLCDQIFGEENFMGSVCRATGQTTGQDSGGLGSSFDYILVYGRNAEFDLSGIPLTTKDLSRFDNEDERGKFAYDQMRKTGSQDRREDRPNLFYPVIDPDGEEVWPIAPAGYESRWRFGRDTYESLLEDDMIFWKKSSRNDAEVWWPYVKYYSEGRTKRPSPLWNDLDGNKKAARDVRALFDGKKVFDFPKPVPMIQRCIQIAPNASKDDIVLDFFAGSASTAQAVMELNLQDGGARRFILVQLPEAVEEGTEAFDAGYRTISEIGRDRIRRFINGVHDGGSDLVSENEKATLAFSAFRLAPSNFGIWHGQSEMNLEEQLEFHADHIDEKSTSDDILYELLIKSGFDLATKIEKKVMAGHEVYSISDGALLICLSKDVTPELIDALADAEPLQVICLDKGFKGNDQLKANAVQTFKSRAKEDEAAIVFRTV